MLERQGERWQRGIVSAATERAAHRDLGAATVAAMRLTRTLVLKRSAAPPIAKEMTHDERAARVWAELS